MELRSGWVVGQGILASEHRGAYEEGVKIVLSKWTALQLAIENLWGGDSTKTKAQDLEDEILDWFYRRKGHYVDELEPLLETVLSEDFNVQAEDGSPRQVAEELIELYEQCLAGDFSIIRRLQARPAGTKQSAGQDAQESESSGDEMDEDDDDAMEEEAPAMPEAPRQPVVDDDGFELVQRGRRRR